MLFSPENPYKKVLQEAENQFFPFTGDEEFESKYKKYQSKIPQYESLAFMSKDSEFFIEEGMKEFSSFLETKLNELEEYVSSLDYFQETKEEYLKEGYFNKYDEDDIENIDDIISLNGFKRKDIYEFIERNLSQLDPEFVERDNNSKYIIIGNSGNDTEYEQIYFSDKETIKIDGKDIPVFDFIRFLPSEEIPSLVKKYMNSLYFSDKIEEEMLQINEDSSQEYFEIDDVEVGGDNYYSALFDIGIPKDTFLKEYISDLHANDDLLKDDDNSFWED